MFRVRWSKVAVDQLANAWLRADKEKRQAITAATYRIDQLLQAAPIEQGESRTGERRIMFVPPLVLLFDVNSEKLSVRILKVSILQ